jgi:hypothetical protein
MEYLNLTSNTFVKCDDHNYDELTNACEKGAKEITYTIKDKDTNRELSKKFYQRGWKIY